AGPGAGRATGGHAAMPGAPLTIPARYAVVIASVVVTLFALQTTAAANPQITPSITVAPNIFPPSTTSSLLACVMNANPESTKTIAFNDVFHITVDAAGPGVLNV